LPPGAGGGPLAALGRSVVTLRAMRPLAPGSTGRLDSPRLPPPVSMLVAARSHLRATLCSVRAGAAAGTLAGRAGASVGLRIWAAAAAAVSGQGAASGRMRCSSTSERPSWYW
jgi:hypothetical protein